MIFVWAFFSVLNPCLSERNRRKVEMGKIGSQPGLVLIWLTFGSTNLRKNKIVEKGILSNLLKPLRTVPVQHYLGKHRNKFFSTEGA